MVGQIHPAVGGGDRTPPSRDDHEPDEVILQQASSSWGRKNQSVSGGWPDLCA